MFDNYETPRLKKKGRTDKNKKKKLRNTNDCGSAYQKQRYKTYTSQPAKKQIWVKHHINWFKAATCTDVKLKNDTGNNTRDMEDVRPSNRA